MACWASWLAAACTSRSLSIVSKTNGLSSLISSRDRLSSCRWDSLRWRRPLSTLTWRISRRSWTLPRRSWTGSWKSSAARLKSNCARTSQFQGIEQNRSGWAFSNCMLRSSDCNVSHCGAMILHLFCCLSNSASHSATSEDRVATSWLMFLSSVVIRVHRMGWNLFSALGRAGWRVVIRGKIFIGSFSTINWISSGEKVACKCSGSDM